MPKSCYIIQDTQTGKYLAGWDGTTATWTDDPSEAYCFANQNDRDAVLALLNSGGGSRFVGPNPKPR